jgi:glutathione synthase/RimK-type ligase-like ATP-grasp enzyme/N-acetylglutamate synthase-like GNAT family acetyltransferase
MSLIIRPAAIIDLPFLANLEKVCFEPNQQNAIGNIKKGILSPIQEILIIESEDHIQYGSAILFKFTKSVRIYSIAVLPNHQSLGLGKQLIDYIINQSVQNSYQRIILEVKADNKKLVEWYAQKGFVCSKKLHDYYAANVDAWKMELKLPQATFPKKSNNVIVINQPSKWVFKDVNATVVSVKEYINNPLYQNNTDLRIFNLCSSYEYQRFGYYVSLLASARGQRVIPSTDTISDFKILNVIHSVVYDIDEIVQKSLLKEKNNLFQLTIYFGQTTSKGLNKLANKLYQLFETPLFQVNFIKHDKWMIKDIKVLTLNKISEHESGVIVEFAKRYFDKKRFNKTKLVNYKYDIAILVDPSEKTPPSCPRALEKFKHAANKKGLYVEFITKRDLDKINEFDALFIRETTSVNDHTYEFSRVAYAEGLVVIDDPWSILKCSNKIYQNELFKKHKILTPSTTIFTKNLFDKKQLITLNYPLVLKQPDSAFSIGITKVENALEALSALKDLFIKSDMVVCQEFLYSNFDWRIGILDNQAIFACKYYMSAGHWQIYNWKGETEDYSGESETVSIENVPPKVLKTALKAASLIGDGLYGVDLKEINDLVYIIEINDNPNIDAGIEDDVLKDSLYDTVIDSIYNRIEVAKNIQKIALRKK